MNLLKKYKHSTTKTYRSVNNLEYQDISKNENATFKYNYINDDLDLDWILEKIGVVIENTNLNLMESIEVVKLLAMFEFTGYDIYNIVEKIRKKFL